MAGRDGRIAFVCSCEDTMAPDARALSRGCGAELRQGEQLCRSQLDRVRAAFAEGRPLTIGCTQEAPLFQQEAEAAGFAAPLAFVNLREHAGWSAEGAAAGPKMAALVAAAGIAPPPTPLVALESQGVTLVLGRDAVALEVAQRLADRLDLTVLLTGEEAVAPLRGAAFPVLRGRARRATGWLGAFEVTVDGMAAAAPSSRAAYRWGAPRDGATSRCDLLLDLTGGAPLFQAHEVRDGYLRADPGDAAAVERLVATAAGLTGTFDKPRFITFDSGLCAHRRNRRTGCTRCLDLCPTGAIAPDPAPGAGSVVVSPEICAGCGACASVCPTGAATYALPPPATLLDRAQALLTAYHAAGGADPVLLLHDAAQGEPLLDALARHGEGLPARVLPLRVNAVGAIGLALLAGAFAWGAAAVRVLAPGRRGHGSAGMLRNLDYAEAALTGLGLGGALPRAAAIETDDPFALGEALAPVLALRTPAAPATFLPLGTPREVMWRALRSLHHDPAPAQVPMPAAAPLGLARVAAEGCTLCLACTMVCPTQAFSANPDRPELSFLEDACVQCGLCAATCPEKVITLEPRLNLDPAAARPAVVKAEEPAICPGCSKAFGTPSSIARVKAKLAGSGHWMFADPARLALLDLCEDCRVGAATSGGVDPYAGAARPAPKTTEDWLRERDPP